MRFRRVTLVVLIRIVFYYFINSFSAKRTAKILAEMGLQTPVAALLNVYIPESDHS